MHICMFANPHCCDRSHRDGSRVAAIQERTSTEITYFTVPNRVLAGLSSY